MAKQQNSKRLETLIHPQIRTKLHGLTKILPTGLVTRFAPSPTGYLHLGHVAAAIYVWGVAKAVGARIQLRIEDHDQGRCRPEYEKAILEDLAWLGWNADEGVTNAASTSLFRQQNRQHRYAEVFAELQRRQLIFPCDCSRKAIAASLPMRGPWPELRYLGWCRQRRVPPQNDFGWRLHLQPRSYLIRDLYMGLQKQNAAFQCGDVLIQDRQQQWTYHFACVIDDWDHGVNLIIRGQDLAHCSARQVQFAQMLGRKDLPYFLHHPLIHDPSGHKLSKRDRATSIRQLRAQGVSAEEIIGNAAYLAAIVLEPKPLTWNEVERIFRS
ncbi:MAG: glutamate--tRNA ligase family protein [Oligoflexus sp.]